MIGASSRYAGPRASAAVEDDQLAREVRRGVTGEEQGGSDDLVRRGDATEGDIGGHALLHLGGRSVMEAVGVEGAADDRVDADASRSVFGGGRLREGVEPGLR